MENFSEFFSENYIWIIGLALFILFTLIGFIADQSRKEKTKQLQKQAVELNKKQEEVKKVAQFTQQANKETINNDVPVENFDNNIFEKPQIVGSSVNDVIPEEPQIEAPKIKDEYQNSELSENTEIPEIKDEFESSKELETGKKDDEESKEENNSEEKNKIS